MNTLDQEEKDILDNFESGTLKQAKDAQALQKSHQSYAEAALKKDARINIRLPSRDLRSLQKRALAEGIPYQTLAASILHKYVEGQFSD